jgi:DNA-binding HxlR family transcriptional regulator
MRFNSTMCPRFQAAVDLLGKRWTAIIVQALLDGPQRFNALAQKVEVVSERMLSERLKELEAGGIVERRVLATSPVHVEYELTDKGRGLGAVMASIGQWAEKWVEVDRPHSAHRSTAAQS